MITLIAAAALSAAAVQAEAIVQPRKTYAACLSAIVKKSEQDKASKSAFETALKAGCKTEEAAFRKAVVDYDVKAGATAAAANQGAQAQIDDYLAETQARYEAPQE